MTKKDYAVIADILASGIANCATKYECIIVKNIASSLADLFSQDNSQFNRSKFCVAVGISATLGEGQRCTCAPGTVSCGCPVHKDGKPGR
jgi:hypothetical protein